MEKVAVVDPSLNAPETAVERTPGAALSRRSGRRAWRRMRMLALGTFVGSLVGCSLPAGDHGGAPTPVRLPSLLDVPAADWAALSGKRIFFGHQSVGDNILDGVTDLMAQHAGIRLELVRLAGPAPVERPALAHAMLGRNGDPASKIRDFRRFLEQGLGERVDVAFFKFCYVDFSHASDSEAIFEAYAQGAAELQEKYPATRFLHVTVPLASLPPGDGQSLRYRVKRLLRIPGVVADNAKRQRFNELLKRRFPAEQVFDLALAEAVGPDGTLHVEEPAPGRRVMMLAPAFTSDGGHLNETGRRRVAEQLLITLARTAGSQRSASQEP